MASKAGVCCHTDACLGGFVLPFAHKLGYPVPAWDFSVPGVTSMSLDSHKFGMAHKVVSSESAHKYAKPNMQADLMNLQGRKQRLS